MKRYALFIVMAALLVMMIAVGSAYLSSASRGEERHPMQEFTAYTLPRRMRASTTSVSISSSSRRSRS